MKILWIYRRFVKPFLKKQKNPLCNYEKLCYNDNNCEYIARKAAKVYAPFGGGAWLLQRRIIMQEIYSISLASLIKELSLDPICVSGEAEDIIISNTQVDRPGLALTGFLDEFEHTRIQIVGVAWHIFFEFHIDTSIGSYDGLEFDNVSAIALPKV